MTITLCEDCFPDNDKFEVLTVVPNMPCFGCGALDGRNMLRPTKTRCSLYHHDPRRKDVPMVETVDPPPTIEASAFEIAMRGLAIIRDGAGKMTDLGDGEGPVLLDEDAIIDLADSFIALALKVAREATDRFAPPAGPGDWTQSGPVMPDGPIAAVSAAANAV